MNCANIEVTAKQKQSVIPEKLRYFMDPLTVRQTSHISPQAYFTEEKIKALVFRNFSDNVLLFVRLIM
jgi:hypothetical protein